MKLLISPTQPQDSSNELRLCLRALRDYVEYCAEHKLDVEVYDLLMIAGRYPQGFDRILQEKLPLNFPQLKTTIRFHEKDDKHDEQN